MGTTERRRLTSKTWADYGQTGIGPNTRHGWEVNADLAYELAERTHLTVEQCRTLIGLSTHGGLPIVITWERRMNAELAGQIETRSTTVLVDQIFPPSETNPSAMPGMVHVRYCGFSHPIYMNEIVDVQNVVSTTTYRDADEEPDREPSAEQERAWDEQHDGTSLGR